MRLSLCIKYARSSIGRKVQEKIILCHFADPDYAIGHCHHGSLRTHFPILREAVAFIANPFPMQQITAATQSLLYLTLFRVLHLIVLTDDY